MSERMKMRKMAAGMVLGMALSTTAASLAAQKSRKVIFNPN